MLAQAEGLFKDLVHSYDTVVPCFPANYEMFRYLVREYHKHFHVLFVRFSSQGIMISHKDTLVLSTDPPSATLLAIYLRPTLSLSLTLTDSLCVACSP